MKIFRERIEFETKTQIEFVNLTDRISEILAKSGIREGVVTVFSPHTTLSVVINHNEPLLLQDFMRILYRVVPVDDQYSHDLFELQRGMKSDGRSNGHSHCKTLLLGSSETIPVERGHLMLTDLQTVFAVEFDGSRKRDVVVQVMGE
ncbi:MAG: YjbQ family protein [Candidatus Moranbacteria bacterium]|nr:YjbQ family protein [Candidatus Moranbacteria bacterium]NTW45784.1 YjbQ family protein [Candidatus Moranbacteria bacterium]